MSPIILISPLLPYNRTYSQVLVTRVWAFLGAIILSAAAAKSLQSCPTLCDPIDGSPPGSSVHGIFQARVLEWGAIAFSSTCYREWPNKILRSLSCESGQIRSDQLLSRVRLLATPWTAADQAPPSLGFSRQKYWSGVPLWLIHLIVQQKLTTL